MKSREEILAKVSAYDILCHYLSPYHNHGKLKQGQNISNPFLAEKQATPSFNIFCELPAHEWKFKDFATSDHGSCFDLVMRLFNLDFIEAKSKICQDFNLTAESKTFPKATTPSRIPASQNPPEFSVVQRDFTKEELDYWLQYGITKDILRRFNVKALSEFSTKNKEGKPYSRKSDQNHFIFAYDQGNWHKLYKPLDEKKYRFQFLGPKPQNFVFGLEQLPEKGNLVFLTGGEKDVMSLADHGFAAISLNSETAKPTPELLADLKARFAEIVVLYDNDETGLKQSETLAESLGFTKVILPAMIEYGKDISDFFQNGFSKEAFEELVENRIPPTPPEKTNLADFANSARLQEPQEPKEDALLNMPFLPDWIYPKLPEILREGSRVFPDRRERDIFLTGALSIISGCMRNVSGGYNGKEHFANLYVFIIAPAASGKGALTYSKQLGEKFHKKLVEESERLMKIYQMELAEYKQKIGDKKNNIKDLEPPTEPPFKVLFIPGNSSSARIIQHLKEGDEHGIFCETEADTIGNVLKQDWGSYSDLLRKAFHHEPVSYSRKTNKEWVEISKPKLSVALAGTPNQVEGLIKSAEDGLFSRFLFYTFKSETVWMDAGPTMNGVNLTQHFDELSDQVLKFIEFLEIENQIKFHLSAEQWKQLNQFGSESIQSLTTLISEDLASTSKRFGLILYRICMVLTALRYFENGETETNFVCSDEDFDIALALMEVYKEHSVFMFRELPKSGKALAPALKILFEALPEKFQRKQAIQLAQTKLNIPERTTDLYLSKLVLSRLLSHPRPGFYEKQSLQ